MKPVLQYLSSEEIEMIHHKALKILSHLGMRLPGQKALRLMADAGAEMSDDEIVKIPPALVDRAIEKAPKRHQVILFGREPNNDVSFKNHDPALACMTMATHVVDPYTGERRLATNQDLAGLTRIAEKMDQIRVNGGLVTPQEVPGEINDWITWATTLKNTSKHITGGVLGERCVQDAASMASAVVGGEDRFRERPFFSGWVLTLPPLGIDQESLEALMEMARWNIPAIVSSGPILGTSSPVTIAGTLAQAHAEILACLAVSQSANPGAPFVYTSFARGMNMRSGNVSMACPEFGILKVAMAQLGRYLDLPVRMPGMLRDSKILDAQAGFETGMIGTMTALTADLIDAMQLDSDLLVDFADPVFCNECMGAVKRLSRELDVSEETMVFDVIKDVGHAGTFLSHDHTFEHFRQELWEPRLLERRNWDSWEEEGARDIRAVALQKTIEILEEDPKDRLPPEVEAEIDGVVQRAQQDYAGMST
jgi:trimethylamine--corrinoid protein Co-methyltransferase